MICRVDYRITRSYESNSQLKGGRYLIASIAIDWIITGIIGTRITGPVGSPAFLFQIPESYAISAGQPTNTVAGLESVPARAMAHIEISGDKLLPMLPILLISSYGHRLFQRHTP